MGCDKGGKYKQVESSTQNASKRCGCPLNIISTPFSSVHIQGIPHRLEGHAFGGVKNVEEHNHPKDLTKRHILLRHKLWSLQEQDPHSVSQITHIYKKRRCKKSDYPYI